MNRVFSFAVAVLSAVALCIVASDANAQLIRRRAVPATQPAQPDASLQNQQSMGGHDSFLANWIGADNQTEISLSQFASQRASNQEVKDFIQEMIRAHTDLANKLNQAITSTSAAGTGISGQVPFTAGYRGVQGTAPAAPGAAPSAPGETPPANVPPGSTLPAPAPAPQGNSAQVAPPATGATATPGAPAATAPASPATNTAPQPGTEVAGNQIGSPATIPDGPNAATGPMQHMNAVTFKRDVDSQLLTLIEEKLGQKKGLDFDRCFIAGQIAGHIHMLAELEVARKQASPQLRPVLDEAATVAQKHLDQAESLLSKLGPQGSR